VRLHAGERAGMIGMDRSNRAEVLGSVTIDREAGRSACVCGVYCIHAGLSRYWSNRFFNSCLILNGDCVQCRSYFEVVLNAVSSFSNFIKYNKT
jgi:hypothetical protein